MRAQRQASLIALVLTLVACSGGTDQAEVDALDEDIQFPEQWRDDESGMGGTLVFGGGLIALDSARCFLQEQDAVGGGKILFVAQAFAVTAGGDEIALDVSRYDEDSQFAGDDVKIEISHPEERELAMSLSSIGDIGTVTLDGSSVTSAGDLTFTSEVDDSIEFIGSFEINC